MIINGFRYYLHAFDVHKCFYGMGEGVRQSLSYEGIKRLMLVVPPETEQAQIVRYIDYQAVKLNELTKANKRQIELLVEYFRRVFSDVSSRSRNKIKLKRLVYLSQDFIVPVRENQYLKAGCTTEDEEYSKEIPCLEKTWEVRLFSG